MLKKDGLGGYFGTYRHGDEDITYHVKGDGSPVFMTMGLSPAGGSYDWRRIFDCLAGAFRVYAMDVPGPETGRHRLLHGSAYYEERIEGFMDAVIGKRTSIISSPIEGAYTLKACFERPQLVEKILVLSPDGVRRIATHDTIGRSVIYRILRIPKIESIMYGNIASKRSMLIFLRKIRGRLPEKRARPLAGSKMRPKYPPLALLSERRSIDPAWVTSLMQAPMKLAKMIRKSRRIVGEMDDFRILRNSRLVVFQRSGKLPMRKDARRFCDDAIKFLG